MSTASIDSTAGNESRPAGLVLRALLRAAMPLADLIVGICWFVVSVVGLSLSVGLLPVFLLGLPVFAALGWLSRVLASFERRRMRLFVGAEIPAAPSRIQDWRQIFTDVPTWRAIAYPLLQMPLAIATFTVTVSAWATSLALVSMPFWLHEIPSRRADAGILTVTDLRTAWLLAAAGLVIGVLAVPITWGLTSLEAALARVLLGSTTRELERQVGELRESRSAVIDSVESERRRIERDLHDGAQQRLVAVAMNLGRAKARYDDDPATAKQLLDEAHRDSKQALTELRDLARGIHPAVLTDRGLDAALSGLASRSPVPVSVQVDVEPRCSATIEAIAYFVVSEALANVAKHAQAHSASVHVERTNGELLIRIRDDGVGGADPARGSGLTGLRDRVAGVDGSIDLVSPPGGPTELTARLPCES